MVIEVNVIAYLSVGAMNNIFFNFRDQYGRGGWGTTKREGSARQVEQKGGG